MTLRINKKNTLPVPYLLYSPLLSDNPSEAPPRLGLLLVSDSARERISRVTRSHIWRKMMMITTMGSLLSLQVTQYPICFRQGRCDPSGTSSSVTGLTKR
jgi:hypothetical protein